MGDLLLHYAKYAALLPLTLQQGEENDMNSRNDVENVHDLMVYSSAPGTPGAATLTRLSRSPLKHI